MSEMNLYLSNLMYYVSDMVNVFTKNVEIATTGKLPIGLVKPAILKEILIHMAQVIPKPLKLPFDIVDENIFNYYKHVKCKIFILDKSFCLQLSIALVSSFKFSQSD